MSSDKLKALWTKTYNFDRCCHAAASLDLGKYAQMQRTAGFAKPVRGFDCQPGHAEVFRTYG